MIRTRQYTNALFDAIEQGILTKEYVIQLCLGWMSEDEVREMVENNNLEEILGLGDDDEDEEDEEDDETEEED